MPKIILTVVFYIFLSLQLRPSIAQPDWIRVGYYSYSSDYEFLISDINSSLFTNIICTYASVNSTSYQLSLSPTDAEHFSTFTRTVKQKNSSLTTLLFIGGSNANNSAISLMVSDFSYRKSFIDSSIKLARLYGFQGLDFDWHFPHTSSDVFNMEVLFQEWRAAIDLEATDSVQSQLILTVYNQPLVNNLTGAQAALYDPSNFVNTDFGIREWINGGLSTNKLVLSLPLFGYAWMLDNPMENGPDVHVNYNSTYVVNYWTKGTTWIGFDDVEAVRAKVSYAKEKKLLGYHVWNVSDDVNWVLSKTAAGVDVNNSSVQEDNKIGQNNERHLLAILLSTTAAFALLLGIFVIFYCWRRNLKLKGINEYTKIARGSFKND
ncbi:class V chitinase-like [Pistacia vera]|uniref:class V chitinase-like n=1 Tax=Pistacia vera TaxID=55513 RepID=UPI001262E85C|nr:class V chitinase-like [Pistacia vera]